jgi:uncharacterized protein
MGALAGTSANVWITMDDGVRLAATLYLPRLRPVPCLLEALPYRKDDVTASYISEYERLRDEYGYAVCRVDLRGTGSSEGRATDEYPIREQDDLVAVVSWLAAQPWCTGNVGMFGTSYSGFNAIQVAMRRPPALKAIVPIYATDDRYTDDVHFMGGSFRLLDLIDYPTYMVALNALPPVPGVYGSDWRDEWRRRLDTDAAPWLLRWITEQTDGPYWRHGSLRDPSVGDADYARITAATMLVAGWSDGYRNNSFRTYQALTAAGTPTRLVAGPWSHMSAANSRPGPHLDLVAEMARWFDRWLRGASDGSTSDGSGGSTIGASGDPPGGEASIVYFARRSDAPEPDAPVVAGEWCAESEWPSRRVGAEVRTLGGGLHTHRVRPDTGTAAWNSCAGQLPYGQPTDQRYDDAASLTWEWPVDEPDGLELLGHARLGLLVAADQPVATVSAKLCDVAEDGTSTLITRGLLNLTHRSGHVEPWPLVPNQFVQVEVELEATAWAVVPGHRLRLAVTGVDWPNTIAPPAPVTLRIDADASTLFLPVAVAPLTAPVPAALRHLPPPNEDGANSGIVWRICDDVLARRTTCAVDHGSTYDIVGEGSCTDHYAGSVIIDRQQWTQTASSSATFQIAWPQATVRAATTVDFTADAERFEVTVSVEATEGDTMVAKRTWARSIPRRLG